MKEARGMDVDVDVVLEGFSTYSHSRLDLGTTEDVCLARILRRPLTSTNLDSVALDRVGALLLLVLLAPL